MADEREQALPTPRESWLKMDPEHFAAAMMRCQHAGAYCAEDGFCHFDGDCFGGRKTEQEAVHVLDELLGEVKALRAEVRALREAR